MSEHAPPRLVIVAEYSLVPDGARYRQTMFALAEQIAPCPSIALQLRAANDPAAVPFLLALCTELRSAAATRAARIIWNGLVPLAGFEWHLPERGLSKLEAQAPAGSPDGAAVHGLDAALLAARLGARWIQYGPVFDPGSKPGLGLGLADLRAFCAQAPRPVIAVGGLRPEHAAPVRAAGAHGLAVASGILKANDPGTALSRYARAMEL